LEQQIENINSDNAVDLLELISEKISIFVEENFRNYLFLMKKDLNRAYSRFSLRFIGISRKFDSWSVIKFPGKQTENL